MELQDFFHEHPKAALGFSGGVDSSYLLWAARQCGADVRPYYIKTAFQPEFEFEDAKRLCREIGAELTVLELDALSDPAVAANPADRCYHCKRNLFGTLAARALADGYTLLLDGTNASDDVGDRPGMRALREMNLRVPQDISVIGIDDIEMAQYLPTKLTSVHIPIEEMGALVTKILIDRINNGHQVHIKATMPFYIAEGESCAKPPKEAVQSMNAERTAVTP